VLPDNTGVVEVAAASGVRLLQPSERDPMRATSYGTGQLIRAALDAGARRLIIGLGGSATVDGGAGIVEALGGRLLDAGGAPIGRGGGGLARLDRIDTGSLDARLRDTEIVVACDVDNPLTGEDGAACVFGPQKGATPDMVAALDRNLEQLAGALARASGKDVLALRGGGAAGGIAATLWALFSARLERGVELMLTSTGFYDHLCGAALVVTSEGMLDRQTLQHKAPFGVAEAARARGVPVIVLAGGIADEVTSHEFAVFDAMLGLCRRPLPLDAAVAKAREWLELAAEQAGRLIDIGTRMCAEERTQ
jgi:glycerate kinase